MAGEPALLLGVGATKVGTTWLYSYLAGHADCRFRSVKELHLFDAIDDGSNERQIRQLEAARDRLEEHKARTRWRRKAMLKAKIADHEETIAVHEAGTEAVGVDRYLAYLMRERGGARVMGDITAAYALLSRDRLARLAPRTRLLYLMRDLVDRLWGHVRMHAVRSAKPGENAAGRAVAALRRVVRKGALPAIVRRGDYGAALSKLLEVATGAQLYLDFYERLFSGEGVARLCDFLGNGYKPAPRVHAGPTLPLDPELRLKTARMLAPQYDFVERTLGPLPERWQANRMGE